MERKEPERDLSGRRDNRTRQKTIVKFNFGLKNYSARSSFVLIPEVPFSGISGGDYEKEPNNGILICGVELVSVMNAVPDSPITCILIVPA